MHVFAPSLSSSVALGWVLCRPLGVEKGLPCHARRWSLIYAMRHSQYHSTYTSLVVNSSCICSASYFTRGVQPNLRLGLESEREREGSAAVKSRKCRTLIPLDKIKDKRVQLKTTSPLLPKVKASREKGPQTDAATSATHRSRPPSPVAFFPTCCCLTTLPARLSDLRLGGF